MYVEVTTDLRVWGKNHGSLEGLEIKNKGEKSEVLWVRLGEPCLPEHHKSPPDFWPMMRCARKTSLKFEGRRPTPLKAPGTPILPILPTSFCTSSLVMYLCLLVDFNILRYI